MLLSILGGILAGVLGFVPLWASLKLSRASQSTIVIAMAGQGLIGVFISLIMLGASMFVVSRIGREFVPTFGAAEIITFVVVTSVYFMWRNRVLRRSSHQ